MKNFHKFLTVVRKKNGDNLLPITIEKYVYFVQEYYEKFKKFDGKIEELIEYMNSIVKQRPSVVIYSAFRMFIIFLGVDKKDDLLKKLKAPEGNASAFRSKRFLQSKVLSRGELKRIFNESNDEEKLIFSALYDTACRRHELCKVKYGDIVFRDDMDNIHAELNVLGKGSKSRVVYFSKTTCDLLKKVKGVMDKDDLVFVLYKKNGKPFKEQPQAMYDFIVNKTIKCIGRKMTPHCFRHTKLTHLADNGADVLGLQKYAGHDNISTIMIYLEISNRMGKITFENYSKDIVIEGEVV